MATSRSRTPLLLDALDQHPDLDLARALLARRSGAPRAVSPFASALQEAGIEEPDRKEPPAARKGEAAMDVARTDLAVSLPVDLGLPIPTAPRMRATRVSGPFRSASGTFWLQFFTPPEAVSVYRKGEARPRFVITSAKIKQPNRASLNVHISAGTIWIAARSLNAAWPAGAYAGFTVEKGTLGFTRRGFSLLAERDGDRITYEDEVDFVLDATPAKVESQGALCPAKPSVDGPESVHIEWEHAKPVAFKIGPASATFAGQTIHLGATSNKPALESDLAAIVFPAPLKLPMWDAAQLESDLVSFSGVTKLLGGWALSLVEAPNGILTEALNPGFFLFRCPNALHAKWGEGEGELALPSAAVAVSEGKFILLQHGGSAEPVTRTLRTWAVREEENAPRLPLTLHFGGENQVFAYVCDAETGESLLASCGVSAALDRPVTIHGKPLVFATNKEAWVAVEKKNGKVRIRVAALDRDAARNSSVVLALRNALVPTTQPFVFTLDGTLSEGGLINEGTVLLALSAAGWLPTLPDPYVASRTLPQFATVPVDVQFPQSAPRTLLVATVAWTAPPLPVVSFAGTVGTPVGVGSAQTLNPARPMQQDESQIRVPTQTAQGAHLPQGLHLKLPTTKLTRAATTPPPRGMRLLDVSTNKDLLGVDVNTPPAQITHFPVRTLDVCIPASALRVFALPQVQWEPVRTLDRDQDVQLGHFPTPLASVTDGGATVLSVNSQLLVPAMPDLAVDGFLEEFEAGRKAMLVTTLPFGLSATLALRPVKTQEDKRQPDLIHRNEPEFVDPDMRGGAQLAFVAESGPSGRRQSSHFSGHAVQTLNGVSLATGAPLGISVLGSVIDSADSVQQMFNNEFAPGGSNPRVPVTRLDVSGYGGSTFSEWLNLDAGFATAARVQFEVLVGRTALEIVKFASVLYPWGVLLTRTVTIERKGGGGVIRRDSGWQPASDGLFQFPGDTEYQVQPGLLRGLFSIRNIRSTGHDPIRFAGKDNRQVVVVPKFFDARVAIEGLEGADTLAGNGILGFLHVEPPGEALTENELATLLRQQGPAGGPVDGVVNAGKSGFRVRATRIEVGIGEEAPELIGVVRSAPIFRQDGSWSAVRGPGPSNPHPDSGFVNVNDEQGLPVVAEGKLLSVDGTKMKVQKQKKIRFCDPADLHKPEDPAFEYAILQTSPAHAFLFPRPYIDVENPQKAIRSVVVPRLADTIARSTSKGLFPPFANAIALPESARVLKLNEDGAFTLGAPVSMTAPREPLVLSQSGSDVMQIDYSLNAVKLSFHVEPDQWHADLTNIEIWNDIAGVQKVLGCRMRVTAGTNTRPVLDEIESLLQEDIDTALSFLRVFSKRGKAGPIDLTATNFSGEAAVGFNTPRVEIKVGKSGSFELGMSYSIGWAVSIPAEDGGPYSLVANGSFDAALEARFGNVYALLLGLSLEISTTVTLAPEQSGEGSFDIRAYIGFSVNAKLFTGSISVGVRLLIEDAKLKPGLFLRIEAEFSLVIVTVSISAELGGMLYPDNSHPPDTKALHGYGEIEVSVDFVFIAFSHSEEFETIKYLD